MERSKKVASAIVVGVFIVGMVLGAILPQMIQGGTSTNITREIYERTPMEYQGHGTYEVIKKVIVIDDNTSIPFNVDESWEIVECMFYPLFTNTDWSCTYALSSASSLVTKGSSGVAQDATDHAMGERVPANRTEGTGQTGFGIWTLHYDISGGPVVVEISKVTHWLN
ncbi:MAG TPA: hypothetical protein VGK23_12405 [Methanomassiliicoccales archaeon]